LLPPLGLAVARDLKICNGLHADLHERLRAAAEHFHVGGDELGLSGDLIDGVEPDFKLPVLVGVYEILGREEVSSVGEIVEFELPLAEGWLEIRSRDVALGREDSDDLVGREGLGLSAQEDYS
jgi:hypothetical protein